MGFMTEVLRDSAYQVLKLLPMIAAIAVVDSAIRRWVRSRYISDDGESDEQQCADGKMVTIGMAEVSEPYTPTGSDTDPCSSQENKITM